MANWNRRSFLHTGLAAGAGVLGTRLAGPFGWLEAAQVGAQAPVIFPDEILNPVEVSGAEAVPIIGRLPGARRMYMLPADQGEFHLVGSQVIKRIARSQETGGVAGVYEATSFSGRTGATMPRHRHLTSHAALLVFAGELELELDGKRWTMMRGDFANIPAGTAHAWTMRSDRTQFTLFTTGPLVGPAIVAMGTPHDGPSIPTGVALEIPAGKLALASLAGDFQLVASEAPAGQPTRVANKDLPTTTTPYVILDGGGDRFGGNVFLARTANTNGQFLFIMTEGGPGGGVGAHFHARHFENFYGFDGETLGWAQGKAVPLHPGDYFQTPPRHLHGFRLNQAYNRFAAFLTPGIFEPFFTRGGGGGARGAGAPPAGGPPRGASAAGGGAPRGGAPGGDMFRTLQMSGRGSDGYPLDVHGATLPLPPQDPIWTQGGGRNSLANRAALLAHAQLLCGTLVSRAITPELQRAMSLKPRATDFL
jgi:quercetin 2,3-dioxygenase